MADEKPTAEQAARLGVAGEVAAAGVRLVGRRHPVHPADEGEARRRARILGRRRGVVHEE